MSQKIVITGTRGYLGSSLVSVLVKGGYSPVALLREGNGWNIPFDIELRYGNLSDKGFLSEALLDADIIFHMGGLKSSDLCVKDIDRAVDSNIIFTANILDAVKKRRPKIIFSSTYWVYGPKIEPPYREDSPLMPSEPYGWTKAIGEKMVMASGNDYIILRLANIFGYGMGRGYEEVASLFLSKAIKRENISLKNNGKNRIDLICIDDVCKVLTKVMNLKVGNMILNIGSGAPISISELAETVNMVSKDVSGSKAGIFREPGLDNSNFMLADRWVDITRLKEYTGFIPTPLVPCLEKLARELLHEKRD